MFVSFKKSMFVAQHVLNTTHLNILFL